MMSIESAEIKKVRKKLGLSQNAFAISLNISIKTLQNWEQGIRSPDGAAVTLLKLINKNPAILKEIEHKQD
jgi:putative transcriptional regulator